FRSLRTLNNLLPYVKLN
ncbi:unnamed protein product, partial [Rotaria sp. Silwood2]